MLHYKLNSQKAFILSRVFRVETAVLVRRAVPAIRVSLGGQVETATMVAEGLKVTQGQAVCQVILFYTYLKNFASHHFQV